MDNTTLKALVVKYKETGMTYQEIADTLKQEYGIERSRQALQGMYQRALKGNESSKKKEEVTIIADTINLYCLGYNMTEVQSMLAELEYNVSYTFVCQTVKNNKDYIKDVTDSLIKKVESYLDKAKHMIDMYKVIEYNGVVPTNKKMKWLVAEAYKLKIQNNFIKYTEDMYNFTSDKSIERKVINDLNLGTLKDACKRQN